MCVLNFSALHHPLLDGGGPPGLLEMGDPLGWRVGVYSMHVSSCQGHWKSDWGGGLRLLLCISKCDLAQCFRVLCVCTQAWFFSCVFLADVQSVLAITPTPNMLSDEIIEWNSAIMSTVHMPDIKSHYYEVRGLEPGPLWAPDGPNELIMGWHI